MQRMFRRSLCRVGLFVVAVSGVALLAPSLAAAQPPTCGEVLVSSVTLHANLVCSNSDGLVVGRSKITINLNNFMIKLARPTTTVGPLAGGGNGTSNPRSASSSCPTGAVVTGLQVGLETRGYVGSVAVICTGSNGRVSTGSAIGDTGFFQNTANCTGTDVGLGIYGYTGDVIDGVGIRCGSLGGTASDGPLVWGGGGAPNGPYDCPTGLALTGLTGTYANYFGQDVVLSLTGVCSIPTSNYEGIDNGGGFNHVTVENGTISGFGTGVYYDSTTRGTISKVTAINNSEEGIDVENSQNGTITNSQAGKKSGGTVMGNGDDGIYLYQNHLVSVTNTKADYNGGAGITDHTSLDTLTGDTTNHNGQWGVFVLHPLTVSSSSGQMYWTVSKSTANRNGLDGFHIDENAPATLYQADLFGNTAEFNSGWGYFADAPAKSNNTNGAKGNSSGNCFHVKCHPIP